MDGIPIWVLIISPLLLLITGSSSESLDVRNSLVEFIRELSANENFPQDPSWGWNSSSDPCTAKWRGVECDTKGFQVKKITLDDFNLTGSIDAESVCSAPGLTVLSMNRNMINGELPEEIGDCRRLTHLYLSGNQLSGEVPEELSRLNNLKRFDISNNSFSGQLPDLARVSGLLSFLVQDNNFTGGIPSGFDFTNLEKFNVSNNNLNGPVPNVGGKFGTDSFSGNVQLCGEPFPISCPDQSPPSNNSPPSPPPNTTTPSAPTDRNRSRDQFLIYSGYMLLVLVVVSFVVVKLLMRNKKNKNKNNNRNQYPKVNNERRSAEASLKTSSQSTSSEANKMTVAGNSRSEMRSEYSITSGDSGVAAASFVLLSSPLVKGVKFNDLLRAPAELLGKGKHGSVYKVVLDNGVGVAVKRTKDWGISSEEFTRRVRKIDKVKHPRVLPPLALYCSDHEKLLVYEYQPNSSLFVLLHGTQNNGQVLDWGSRLVIASCVSEALAFMHLELNQDGIAHGNLKSTNILFNKDMEPCVSEYGLMVAAETSPDAKPSSRKPSPYGTFKVDVYAFGVLLLEMLTGKLVQNNGDDLAKWVHSVVREEWTVEVFARSLTSEGANEERMVNLLQVAFKCINHSPNERPSMNQVAVMVNAIREEEDRSVISSSEA
ncbi:Probable inactive receptor kinase At2g26730 [Linum grandiflorum]